MTDGEAIGASLTEPERFARIFHRHWDEIHRYITRRLGPQLAEDVGAETFAVAFRNRQRYDLGRADARPWLYGIATNLIRQHRRTERRHHRLLARVDAEWSVEAFDQSSDDRLTAQRLGPRLASALARLSPAERDLLLLIAWADLTYEETAQALGLPLGTVRSRLHRGRKKFRRALGDIDPMRMQEDS
ncbi:RNA polymerase sigma factor [Actinomadura sp. 6K520]|jgi:RNA polymerase sigma-70 factor (ECF subfamily)|uniref:RNA polymerase sigma factor n=1 Tax=Actinomadura sp. 6K520 TaxID=2530364 RepID=UPI001053DE33|nr:RNA polymerase sigma factor [Actinomadura sp. 6K520]TDE33301.1 RNA polymerase sigma factor [Actinomadura sp. 6K520]